MGPGFCEVCGGYIVEGQTYWRAEFHQDGADPRGPDDVALFGSMECFIQFIGDLAQHYLQHLAGEATGNGNGKGHGSHRMLRGLEHREGPP